MDPVTLAVVRGSLEQIADEMDLHLIHAAISPIISETNDCANGIFHPVTGETIAQGRYGLPVFLAYMQFTVQKVIELANAEGGFKPGDMWIMNDTYLGGSHLQDVQIIAPVFVQGELFAVMATTGHWMDMGGNVPGGWAPRATEIHQEGMIIPPIGIIVFVMHGMAPDIALRTIYRGVAPFIVADLLLLALLACFPAISLWLPALLKT